ncbi:MAG: hypothetical protein ACO1OB_25325 [Archangium sp.]
MLKLIRGLVLSSSLLVVGCGSKPEPIDAGTQDSGVVVDAGQTHDAGVTASGAFDAMGGVIELDALHLSIGAGALGTATTLTVRLTDEVPQVADVTPLSPVFEFGPAGTQFVSDVSVSFDVTPAQAGDVQLVYWTNAAGEFEPLPSWWSSTGRVYARAKHFSRAFVGKPATVPSSLTCSERMCLPSSAKETLVLAADGGVGGGAGFQLRVSTDYQPGSPRKLEVRETPARPEDLGGASAGVVLDFKISPFITREVAEVCVAVAPGTDAGAACLAYFEEGRGRWVCEDECLAAGSDGKVCGKTSHFTNFAILLDGASQSRTCP